MINEFLKDYGELQICLIKLYLIFFFFGSTQYYQSIFRKLVYSRGTACRILIIHFISEITFTIRTFQSHSGDEVLFHSLNLQNFSSNMMICRIKQIFTTLYKFTCFYCRQIWRVSLV